MSDQHTRFDGSVSAYDDRVLRTAGTFAFSVWGPRGDHPLRLPLEALVWTARAG